MALSVRAKDVEADARRLAARRNTSVTGAIRMALKNELANDDDHRAEELERYMAGIREIQDRVAPYVRKDVTEDDIMGWDENGLPT